MSICFDVNNMNAVMGKFCPEGENVITAIYGVGKSADIIQYFGGCQRTPDTLVPAGTNNILKVLKRKVCTYDLYIGYTEHSLIISECDMSTTYYYEFEDMTGSGLTMAKKLEKEITHKSIGKAFPLKSIKEFKMKNGWFGSVKCVLTLDNGTVFKFMLTKRAGGLVSPMPNHEKNRDSIIEVLEKYSK